jgi:translocation and assembly module TamB
LNGFDLVGARANLTIPKNDPFPLDIDGQAVGEIDADISVAADVTPDRRTMNVKVDIPRLHVQLPLASSNTPQELGEADKIRVGYFRRPRQFVILPKDAEDLEEKASPAEGQAPTTTNVAIHLGDDVEVRRGTTLRIALTGNPKIELAEEPKMSGQLRLTRGMLEVQGRRFQVEKGVVNFVGKPDNPQVVVTAAWDAPDGTRVYADFTGPLKTGKVKLRSEPSRPQNEILALIMFGTVEGSSSTPYPTQQPNGATRAGTMAGGLATEGLSKGLDEPRASTSRRRSTPATRPIPNRKSSSRSLATSPYRLPTSSAPRLPARTRTERSSPWTGVSSATGRWTRRSAISGARSSISCGNTVIDDERRPLAPEPEPYLFDRSLARHIEEIARRAPLNVRVTSYANPSKRRPSVPRRRRAERHVCREDQLMSSWATL